MEQIFKQIWELRGETAFSNGKMLIALFCDLSRDKKDMRILRYFVECQGHTLLLAARNLSPAMQQARLGQVVNKICSETLVSEEVAQTVCHAFWSALYGTAVPSKPEIQTAPETFAVDPGLEIEGDTVVRYTGSQAHVRIPAGIVTIGKDAFRFNKNLTSVEFPEGLQTIGKMAFYGAGLREVRFPDSLKTIDTWGFSDTQLESVVLPLGLKDASAWSFGSCKKLRKVEFRHMPERLHPFIFNGSDNLEELVFPEGTERIDLDNFRHCKAFMRIHIPDSVKEIRCFFAKDEQQFEIIASQKWIAAHQKLISDNPNCSFVPSDK